MFGMSRIDGDLTEKGGEEVLDGVEFKRGAVWAGSVVHIYGY